MEKVNRYLEQHREAFERDLCELLRIESVSADSQRRGDVRRAAQWVETQLGQLGLATQQIETAGHPLVYAESPPVPGAPVALIYGHYDVQPPDPLDEWISPPFEPTIRDGNVYARGATDDKGQMLTHVKSAQAWIESGQSLPIQLKYLIEGEEEVGSENLEAFIATHGEQLACDCVVISDTSQLAPGRPAITYGLRGIAYYELRLQGPRQDLHSGTFGGAVTNPANSLACMLAALVDVQGRIQLPGFYDDVVDVSAEQRAQFRELPFSEEEFFRQFGVEQGSGEAGYSALERRWVRPSLDINGLTSGYQGEGAKTVLPARASAKLSFRLAPHQDPEKITRTLKSFFQSLLPPGIEMELIDMHGAPAVVVSRDSPYVQAAARAIEKGFGQAPVFVCEGGSIPIVSTFHRELGADTLLLGWGQNDDNTHSPNEKFSLADYHGGIRASAWLWAELAAIQGS